LKTKINIADLRDKVQIKYQGAEHDADGMPGRAYSNGPEIYAMVRRGAMGTAPDEKMPDKYKMVQKWNVTIRKEGYPIKVNDVVFFETKNLPIEAIDDIDLWYQTLKCSDAN
jgi:hypothetical protein